jgi:hypothetical protein
MKKIYEFIENNDKKNELLKCLDAFVFFDGDVWMFADGDREFLSNYIDNIIPVDDFINLGTQLADNLNKMNIDVSDYDAENIEQYLNN